MYSLYLPDRFKAKSGACYRVYKIDDRLLTVRKGFVDEIIKQTAKRSFFISFPFVMLLLFLTKQYMFRPAALFFGLGASLLQIFVIVLYVYLFLVRFSKKTGPMVRKAHQRFTPYYLGESDQFMFFFDSSYDLDPSLSAIRLPDNLENSEKELILSSVFFKAMCRRTRSVSFHFLSPKEKSCFFMAVSEIILDQYLKDNHLFFKSSHPWDNYIF